MASPGNSPSAPSKRVCSPSVPPALPPAAGRASRLARTAPAGSSSGAASHRGWWADSFRSLRAVPASQTRGAAPGCPEWSGGIELEAPVQLVEIPVREALAVEVTRQPAALVEVAIILSCGAIPCGQLISTWRSPRGRGPGTPTYSQTPRDRRARCRRWGPPASRHPARRRDRAALRPCHPGCGPQHHQPLPTVVPHLGVAHMAAVACGQVQHGAQLGKAPSSSARARH